ncbi:bifunctional protein FolD 2 [Tanacetum coccineum]|uniref:methenyltetrahydrofolate cyclohydrolase n=1 Tax=Tanacetum coccineum TaxID=301880 RepID=A0ABQ5H9V2_9ASTR
MEQPTTNNLSKARRDRLLSLSAPPLSDPSPPVTTTFITFFTTVNCHGTDIYMLHIHVTYGFITSICLTRGDGGQFTKGELELGRHAPGLAVVIVGHRKDSQSYVNMKRKACAAVGIKSVDIDLPEQVPEAELIAKVHELNANPEVHGILVQLPLLKHINEEKVLTEISIDKDVDGFHPLNIGKLAMKAETRSSLHSQSTRTVGCIELLKRSVVIIKGKRAVVVGRSNIVGLPISLLLLKADATIKGGWLKPGAAVIDVGTNAVNDASRKSGYRLVGDVDYQEGCKVARCIMPVPGGVGHMTIAMLLKNTLDGAKRVIGQ